MPQLGGPGAAGSLADEKWAPFERREPIRFGDNFNVGDSRRWAADARARTARLSGAEPVWLPPGRPVPPRSGPAGTAPHRPSGGLHGAPAGDHADAAGARLLLWRAGRLRAASARRHMAGACGRARRPGTAMSGGDAGHLRQDAGHGRAARRLQRRLFLQRGARRPARGLDGAAPDRPPAARRIARRPGFRFTAAGRDRALGRAGSAVRLHGRIGGAGPGGGTAGPGADHPVHRGRGAASRPSGWTNTALCSSATASISSASGPA